MNDPNLCVKKSDIELIKEFYGEKLSVEEGDVFASFVTGFMDMLRRDERIRDCMYEGLKFWKYMIDHIVKTNNNKEMRKDDKISKDEINQVRNSLTEDFKHEVFPVILDYVTKLGQEILLTNSKTKD